MTFKASYFSVSLPLIKENLRRFWAIPALGFLAYFLSSVVPILMSYNHIDDMYDYIEMTLANQQPFFVVIHILMPIITAVIVFRYMQNGSSATAMHSMPFTRFQLFNSNVLSGLILIITPLLANEIILQIIAKPTYAPYMYTNYEKLEGLLPTAINAFNRADTLTWLWQSILIVSVLYAISVFAGMVTGNTVMHLAMAFGLNALAPALYTTFILYCSNFLFGFESEGIHETVLCATSPILQIFYKDAFWGDATSVPFALPMQLYYILFALVTLALSGFLYQRRALEKAGDSIVFRFMIPTICYLITFFGMSLMGYYFTALNYNRHSFQTDDSNLYFYCGLIAGAIITFIIGRMIVLKTPRVFNKSSLKSFCLYAVIATLFVTSITLDLTGFEKRVPNTSKVSGIYFSGFHQSASSALTDTSYFKSGGTKTKDDMLCYRDPKNIEAFASLHKEIIAQKEDIQNEPFANYYNYRTSRIALDYQTTSPFGVQRAYNYRNRRFIDNKYLKQIYESAEHKNFFSLTNLNYDKYTKLSLSNIFYYDDISASKLLLTETAKITSLLDAMERDFQSRTFEEYTNPVHPYCNVSLGYTYTDEQNQSLNNYVEISVLSSDKNTITWIKENGYSVHLECTPAMIDEIIFTEWNSEKERKFAEEQDVANAIVAPTATEEYTFTEEKSAVNMTGQRQLVITDKAQIQQILDTCADASIYPDNYFEGTIQFTSSAANRNSVTNSIYFSADNAPKFLQDYFNEVI